MLDCGVAYNINLLIITHMKLFIKFKIVFMTGQFQRMFVSCGGNGVLRRRGFLRGRWDEAGCFRMESSGFVEIGLVQAGLAGGVP